MGAQVFALAHTVLLHQDESGQENGLEVDSETEKHERIRIEMTSADGIPGDPSPEEHGVEGDELETAAAAADEVGAAVRVRTIASELLLEFADSLDVFADSLAGIRGSCHVKPASDAETG